MEWPALLSLFFLLFGPAPVPNSDYGVRSRVERTGSEVRIIMSSDHLRAYNLTFRFTLTNMEVVQPAPYVFDELDQVAPAPIVLRVIDPAREPKWDYGYYWLYGTRGANPDSNAVYQLPYRTTDRHELIQGYGGSFSHQVGTVNEHAYDFEMPEGTTICAARDGEVVGVRQDSNVHGTSKEFLMSGNYVIIRHTDGTYAEYLHLKKDGAKVVLGDHVVAGQPIGLSGFTGFTSRPHLHFCVYRLVDTPQGVQRQSLAVRMQTREGVRDQPLVENHVY